MKEIILAIDCGTTNLKAALFDYKLNCMISGETALEYLKKDTISAEFQGKKVWQTLKGLIIDLAASAGIKTERINKISITGQANSITILDDKFDEIMPFISWLDIRSKKESRLIYERFKGKFQQHCSIKEPRPGMAVSKLLWLKKHNPEVLDGDGKLISFLSYIAMMFTSSFVTEPNTAALEGIYSIPENKWRQEILDYIGINAAQLPEIITTGSHIPVIRQKSGLPLPGGIKVIFAGNDQTANAVANDLENRNIIINLGTALVLYRKMGIRMGPFGEDSIWGPYPEGGFYEMYCDRFGTNAVDWALNELLYSGDIQEFIKLASSRKYTTDSNIFFYPSKIGSNCLWKGDGNREQKARAVFEGMCFYIKDKLESLFKVSDLEYSLTLTGGGSKNSYWSQMIADVLGKEISLTSGDTLLGCAKLAVKGSRLPGTRQVDRFHPDKKKTEWFNKQFKKWSDLNA